MQHYINQLTFKRLKSRLPDFKPEYRYRVDPKDPVFDKPLNQLYKDYGN